MEKFYRYLCTIYIFSELDKIQSTLEKTEKKIRETDHAIQVAKGDAINLEKNIQNKDDEMKQNVHNANPKEVALTKETAKYVGYDSF